MANPDLLALASMSPGELLEKVLADRGIPKTDFGERVGGGYRRVQRWIKNIGFNSRNRRLAARELGLQLDFFDRPELNDGARERESHRRTGFKEWLETPKGKRLSESSPEIVACIDSVPIPPGTRASIDFFDGIALVYTGQLTREEMEESLGRNIAVRQRVVRKTQRDPARARH
jgi:hypothetical protein